VVAKLGDQVSPHDVVARDGVVLQRANRTVYLKYHKPVGVTTTTELHVPRNIISEIRHPERIFPIGRLDKDSSGLILLTNDGDIVNEILRVEHGHEREYRVEVDREFDEAFLAKMAQGVMILGARTRPVYRDAPRAAPVPDHFDGRAQSSDSAYVPGARVSGRRAASCADHAHHCGGTACGAVEGSERGGTPAALSGARPAGRAVVRLAACRARSVGVQRRI
jgi:hypothetical protein